MIAIVRSVCGVFRLFSHMNGRETAVFQVSEHAALLCRSCTELSLDQDLRQLNPVPRRRTRCRIRHQPLGGSVPAPGLAGPSVRPGTGPHRARRRGWGRGKRGGWMGTGRGDGKGRGRELTAGAVGDGAHQAGGQRRGGGGGVGRGAREGTMEVAAKCLRS
jgi:hypothetical protein